MKFIFFILFSIFFLFINGRIYAQVKQKDIDAFLNDSAVRTGHAGISIYEPATGKYLYNYNADKNFIPSSNVKLFTLYAGMKYLGDSIIAAKVFKRNDTIFFEPTGDPTFLHKDFPSQPLLDFLSAEKCKLSLSLSLSLFANDRFEKYGSGWAWDDYQEDFMPERNRFPLYGNVFSFILNGNTMRAVPHVFKEPYFEELMVMRNAAGKDFKIIRKEFENRFYLWSGKKPAASQQIPFITREYNIQLSLLGDTLHRSKDSLDTNFWKNDFIWKKIYSRPVDSLFKPMMFTSDNFFAEQTLLMVSNERLGFMSDEQIIDTLLKTDMKGIPNKPRWVDGSGLSRYNLFSPKAFIYILDKLQKEFGMERMRRILPTGGQGTLTNYYDKEAGYIYAKTGSMSNNVALSGYLFTRKNKILLFSILVNNYMGSGREGRRAIEKFIRAIRESN